MLLQDNESWDYLDDVRAGNDTMVSLENNAGYTALLTAMNQVSPCGIPWMLVCLRCHGLATALEQVPLSAAVDVPALQQADTRPR